MKTIRNIIIYALLFTSGVLSAQEISLETAVALALEKNPTVRVLQNQLEVTQNNTSLGQAGLLPRVDLSAGATYNDNVVQAETGEVTTKSTATNAGVNLSYTLFDGMKSIENYKKLKEQLKYAEINTRNNIDNIILNVVNAYLKAMNQSDILKVSKEQLAISVEQWEKAKTQKEFGQKTSLDVMNAQVAMNQDSSSLLQNENNYLNAVNDLKVLLNLEMDTLFNLVPLNTAYQEIVWEVFQQKCADNNASLLLKANERNQAAMDVKIQKASYSPQLKLNSSYGYNQTATDLAMKMNDPNRTFSAGLSLTYNIYSGGTRKAQISNSRIAAENADLNYIQAENELEKEMANAYKNYTTNQFLYEKEKRNLELAELNFEQSTEYYQLGRITSTQFREAQLNLARSKNSLSSAYHSLISTQYNLHFMTGELMGQF